MFSKLLERLIYNRLTSFLKRCNILYEKQFGFRKKHSTSHATAYLSSEILKTLDKSEKAIGVFMDLSKAFDTINIEILVEKLNHYGIRGIANNWFKSYLTGRSQFVSIHSYRSENVCRILHGVPQGSILGPLLFSLYINDFWKCLKFGEAIMFADDTTIVFKGRSMDILRPKVNADLASAADWLAENKLSLNVKKTKCMIFEMSRSKKSENIICINDKCIEEVKSKKFLGVIFDEKLTWKEHIKYIISKLNSCLCATRRARAFLNQSSLFNIYHSLMQSRIDYCCSTWAAWEPRGNKVILQRLQAVCNKFFRLIFKLDRTDSVRSLLKANNVLNVFQNYNFNINKVMHKAIHDELPIPLKRSLTIDNEFFFFKACRIKQTEKSMYYAGPKLWNNLPGELVEEPSFTKFKTDLKKFILHR